MKNTVWDVVVYKKNKKSYVRVVSRNGNIILTSEANGYKHWWHAKNIGLKMQSLLGGNIKFYQKGILNAE